MNGEKEEAKMQGMNVSDRMDAEAKIAQEKIKATGEACDRCDGAGTDPDTITWQRCTACGGSGKKQGKKDRKDVEGFGVMEDPQFEVYQEMRSLLADRLHKANYSNEDAKAFCSMLTEDLQGEIDSLYVYDQEPEIDDSIKSCPDCETPNQFGERCQSCVEDEQRRLLS